MACGCHEIMYTTFRSSICAFLTPDLIVDPSARFLCGFRHDYYLLMQEAKQTL